MWSRAIRITAREDRNAIVDGWQRWRSCSRTSSFEVFESYFGDKFTVGCVGGIPGYLEPDSVYLLFSDQIQNSRGLVVLFTCLY
jgi:hypothetical protein